MNGVILGEGKDPSNIPFELDGLIYRVCTNESAELLTILKALPIYENLIRQKKIVQYEEVSKAEADTVIQEFEKFNPRPDIQYARVFRTERILFRFPPRYWTTQHFVRAALLTCELRKILIPVGMDLKDGNATNVQFIGHQPIFIDLGSISPLTNRTVWPGLKQFVESLINPIFASNGIGVFASMLWNMGSGRLESVNARKMMRFRDRLKPDLFIIQNLTKTKKARVSHTKVDISRENLIHRQLVHQSVNRKIERLLHKELDRVSETKSYWRSYSSREHYKQSELEKKIEIVSNFLLSNKSAKSIVDFGGNDGFVYFALNLRAKNYVWFNIEADQGSLEKFSNLIFSNLDSEIATRVYSVFGDISLVTNELNNFGIEAVKEGSNSGTILILCHAVLHHLVISQGLSIMKVIELFRKLNAPIQIEFVLPQDEKVVDLIEAIEGFQGIYSLSELQRSLSVFYAKISPIQFVSKTRVVIEAHP